MTRLKMHWHLVEGADGRKHLDMAWEAATVRMVRRLSGGRLTRVRGESTIRRQSSF